MTDVLQNSFQPLSEHNDLQAAMASSTSSLAMHGPRRPARKSTLTQQQKLSKRQRATQDQLMTLEIEFNKNPTPTAAVRERIAQDINMTERSVQIWFQNRRAKIKNIAKRSIESGEPCDSIPDSMRQYLALQQYGAAKGLTPGGLNPAGPGLLGCGNGMLAMNAEGAPGKVVIQHFACRSLSIGTWRRVGQSTMDLVIFYSPDKACITYYINNDSAGYKIEFPFAWIKSITLEQGDVLSAAEGASQRPGGLVIELTRPPKFYMDSSGSGGFYECGDFTEDQQASQILLHHLGGPSKVLSGQLAKLVSLDVYQNRHKTFFDPSAFVVSAPVSPIVHRPQSQPNHMMHPHKPMHLFPPDNAPGLMGPPGPRGHKRQRSRSVPVAMDFSQLRPMPSFLIQPAGQVSQPPVQDPSIFAPIPQHQHTSAFAPGPMGPNLSIDTSTSYNAFQFGPVSATTANSPSEYGTPAFFTSAPPGDGLHPTHFNNPFHPGYLAIDPAAMIGTSNTPLSMMSSHGDPIIADHSPPLNGMGRSQSTDIFGTPGEHSQFGDEGMFLSDSFNKQLALPFRSPLSDESYHSPMPEAAFTFHSPPTTSSDSTGVPSSIAFQSPTRATHPNDSVQYHSPSAPQQQHQQQIHQDSGVAISTPSQEQQQKQHQLPAHLQSDLYHDASTPNNPGIMYQDTKLYSSPASLGQVGRAGNCDLTATGDASEVADMQQQLQMFGTIDPNALGQPPRH